MHCSGFRGGSDDQESSCSVETWVRSLGWEEPLEKGMAAYSSIAWWMRMDRGAWRATVRGVTKSPTQLNDCVQHCCRGSPFITLPVVQWCFTACMPQSRVNLSENILQSLKRTVSIVLVRFVIRLFPRKQILECYQKCIWVYCFSGFAIIEF